MRFTFETAVPRVSVQYKIIYVIILDEARVRRARLTEVKMATLHRAVCTLRLTFFYYLQCTPSSEEHKQRGVTDEAAFCLRTSCVLHPFCGRYSLFSTLFTTTHVTVSPIS